jgi:hypothetical protein
VSPFSTRRWSAPAWLHFCSLACFLHDGGPQKCKPFTTYFLCRISRGGDKRFFLDVNLFFLVYYYMTHFSIQSTPILWRDFDRQHTRSATQFIVSKRISMEPASRVKLNHNPPSPFQPNPNDKFIEPLPDQLISYKWTTPPPEQDYYRTGVLLREKKGNDKLAFYQIQENGRPWIFTARFNLYKKQFELGNFRSRLDLQVGR